MRVTADTNIIISAWNFGGGPERLLRLAEAGAIQLVISEPILTEVAKVLRSEKFAWPEREIDRAVRQLTLFCEHVQPSKMLSIVTVDPPDNRILECAETGKADYIVSGDKHLLELKQHRNAPIVKVAEFLRRFEEQAGPQ